MTAPWSVTASRSSIALSSGPTGILIDHEIIHGKTAPSCTKISTIVELHGQTTDVALQAAHAMIKVWSAKKLKKNVSLFLCFLSSSSYFKILYITSRDARVAGHITIT